MFKDVGLVEQLDSGMSRILQFYDRDIFQISNHHIKAIFPFSLPKENVKVTKGDEKGDEKAILMLLEKEPSLTGKK